MIWQGITFDNCDWFCKTWTVCILYAWYGKKICYLRVRDLKPSLASAVIPVPYLHVNPFYEAVINSNCFSQVFTAQKTTVVHIGEIKFH